MKPKLKDEEIIRQYLDSNSNDCFETLYNRYVNKVYSRCLSLTKDSEKAQDFTHDIFIRMFSHLDRFQERSSFSTWLYSISYNYCMDQLRVGNRLPTSSLSDNDDADDRQIASTDDAEDLNYSLQKLSWAMKNISQEEASILRMKYQDGLDIRQIANQLNLNESAVKMRLKRTRDKVRQLYERSAYVV
ncbi:sigma-70 family RNA polymerase sigma factor [Spirosoma sp. SC4-14]|uniref:RNA polymerase sigma factor n=1 Tax=Spirosoma sp. SC4-14 TaxID=3128900 RepID=UPI0030CB7ACA